MWNLKDTGIYEDEITTDENFDDDPIFLSKSPQNLRKNCILGCASSFLAMQKVMTMWEKILTLILKNQKMQKKL